MCKKKKKKESPCLGNEKITFGWTDTHQLCIHLQPPEIVGATLVLSEN